MHTQGPPGQRGERGLQGPPGNNGRDGADGVRGAAGEFKLSSSLSPSPSSLLHNISPLQVQLVLLERMVYQVFLEELEQRENLVSQDKMATQVRMEDEANKEIQVLRVVLAHKERRDQQETLDHPDQQVLLVSLEILVFPDPLAHRGQAVHPAQLVPLVNQAQKEAPVSTTVLLEFYC